MKYTRRDLLKRAGIVGLGLGATGGLTALVRSGTQETTKPEVLFEGEIDGKKVVYSHAKEVLYTRPEGGMANTGPQGYLQVFNKNGSIERLFTNYHRDKFLEEVIPQTPAEIIVFDKNDKREVVLNKAQPAAFSQDPRVKDLLAEYRRLIGIVAESMQKSNYITRVKTI